MHWSVYQIWTLRWRHNERDGVWNHAPNDCLLNRLFRPRSKKTSKLRVTGLCAGNSPGTGEFPAQMASNAENVSIWWRHHEIWNKETRIGMEIWSYSIEAHWWPAPAMTDVAQYPVGHLGQTTATSSMASNHRPGLHDVLLTVIL